MPDYNRPFVSASDQAFLDQYLDKIVQYDVWDSRSVDATQPSTVGQLKGYGVTCFTGSTAKTWVLEPPSPYNRKILHQISTSTVGFKVTLPSTSYTFDGTNHFITLNALDDCVELLALSSTRYIITARNSIDLTTV